MSLPDRVYLPLEDGSFVPVTYDPNGCCLYDAKKCSGSLKRVSTGHLLCGEHRKRLGQVMRAAAVHRAKYARQAS